MPEAASAARRWPNASNRDLWRSGPAITLRGQLWSGGGSEPALDASPQIPQKESFPGNTLFRFRPHSIGGFPPFHSRVAFGALGLFSAGS